MELNDKIINLIKDNMNETQKGLLGDFFKDHEWMKNQLKETKLSLEKTTESLKHYQSEFEKLNAIKKNMEDRISKYDQMWIKLQQDRLEFDLKVAQKEIEFMRNNYAEIRNLVEMAFRNPKYMTSFSEYNHVPAKNTCHGWQNDMTETKTTTVTKTQE